MRVAKLLKFVAAIAMVAAICFSIYNLFDVSLILLIAQFSHYACIIIRHTRLTEKGGRRSPRKAIL